MSWFVDDLPPPRIPATWAWDDDQFGADRPAGTEVLRGGEVPEGWTRYKNEPPPSDWGRIRGHHPPRDPISNFEWQTLQQYNRVKHEVYNRTNLPKVLVDAVKEANEDVVRALRDSSKVDRLASWSTVLSPALGAYWKATGYRSCLSSSRADAGMVAQQQFNERCEKWIEPLTAAKARLGATLGAVRKYDRQAGRKVTEVGLQEIEESLVDQSTGMEERWEKTTDAGPCDEGPFSVVGIPTKLGRSICIPPVAQWMIIGLGAYVVFGFLPGMFAAAKVATAGFRR